MKAAGTRSAATTWPDNRSHLVHAGNPHYLALPWLPYRLAYAYRLAEAGHVSQATAYCARLVAIFEKITKPPPSMMVAKSLAADLASRLTMHAQVSLLKLCRSPCGLPDTC